MNDMPDYNMIVKSTQVLQNISDTLKYIHLTYVI